MNKMKRLALLAFTIFIFIMAFPLCGHSVSLTQQDFIITIDGTTLSDGDTYSVLSKNLGSTARLNVYVYHSQNQTSAEFRLYRGSYTSSADYSEASAIRIYPLSLQQSGGFTLTNDVQFSHGNYTLALFADSSSLSPITAVIISVSRPIISEEITSVADCIHSGTKRITYEDDGDPTTADYEDVTIPQLGHTWGSWEHLKETHRHTRICSRVNCGMRETNSCEYVDGVCRTCRGDEGHRHILTHVPSKASACTENGTIEHYVCECGKIFLDIEATNEVTDRNTLVIPSLGHSYGSWSYNATDKTHTRICLRNLSHKETKNCSFNSGVITDFSVLYTCKECNGTYTEGIYKGHALRIYGADRFETAFLAADTLKQSLGVDKFQSIVVASGMDFADALSGSYLANRKNAPILLVKTQTIDKVSDYILKNLAPGGTVYILGGTNAIPVKMEDKLYSVNVKRLQGATRYETNLAILNEAGINGSEILVCTGLNFADGLSASAVNRPILLVRNSLTAEQKAYLSRLNGAKITIIGGEVAVTPALENELKAYGTVDRIYGANRYETSVNIAKKFFPNAGYAVFAYGDNFPDGLSGGPLAKSMGAPLILSSNASTSYAKAYTDTANIRSGIVLGGSGLISDASVKSLFSLGNQEIIVLTR